MLACYAVVSFIGPLLLWGGGALMSAIFGFGSHWALGVYMVAGLVGAAGFMTIVGRRRANLSVDVLAITAWLILGFAGRAGARSRALKRRRDHRRTRCCWWASSPTCSPPAGGRRASSAR